LSALTTLCTSRFSSFELCSSSLGSLSALVTLRTSRFYKVELGSVQILTWYETRTHQFADWNQSLILYIQIWIESNSSLKN